MENFSMINFNYFDVTIGAIVLILGIKGFMNGFLKEAFGLVGLIGGVYFASRLSGDAAQFIDKNLLHMDNMPLLKLLGFIAILVIIWSLATILGSVFSKLMSNSGFGFLNRSFGFILGGGKYFLIFALIVTALSNVTLIKDNLEKHVHDSILYPYLKMVGSTVIHLDPKSIGLENSNTVDVLKDVANLKKPAESQTDTSETNISK
ncbi:Colicin V production protein [hydrothermal vent metagenome]|uniref:Colicin V production protein n=1 Tax=hydrothermal vent metagenome TaxID=652676 RepID=A0A1W1EC86_9ZZZZ